MKFCPNCGTQTDDSHPFCSKCGYKFAPVQQNPNAFAYQTPPVQTNPQMPIKKKKSKAPLIIAIVAVVVLAVLAALFFFTNVFGNHVVQVKCITCYLHGERTYEIKCEFDRNGDMVKKTDSRYTHAGKHKYIYLKFIWNYEYDGKHNMTGCALTMISYDDLGQPGPPSTWEYDVEGYKEDGLWYYDRYDKDHNYGGTWVYDKHRMLIQEFDEDGQMTYEAEYKYDFLGKIVSLNEISYPENPAPQTMTMEFEYDGDKMTGTYTDASNWDEYEESYENSEVVYDWNFYYFW